MATTTELNNWLNGTATGGPNGDGRYPLTSSTGVVSLVPCPAIGGSADPLSFVYGDLAFKDTVDWNIDIINRPVVGSGTVTSVGVANTTGLTWTGGPITGAGTLTPTLSANLQAWSAVTVASKANLASPALTGTPTAPTAASSVATTQLATTAFVKNLFGATSTAGTTDWNDVTNTRPGTSPTLLLGTAPNGPGVGTYFHILNFEYNTKAGTGNLTQYAIPYNGTRMFMRYRYSAVWSAWTEFAMVGHTHVIADVSGLQTVLDTITTKAPLASPALTGTPTGPTAGVGTNTTQLATTAFAVAEIDNRAPTKAGVGASGTWSISITGAAASAPILTTARTIALSGGVTGTATAFNGSANITIPVTALDANLLSSGTVPSARMVGAYNSITLPWANIAGRPVAVTTLVDGLMTAADKSKLDGIAAGANNYTHPASHPATMITEDATHRFFTDTERTKLTGIATGANNYTHPSTHPASMIVEDSTHRFVTDAEKAIWNAGGGGGGGGNVWLQVAANTLMSYGVNYTVSGARDMTLPAGVVAGTSFTVCSLDANVRIVSNGNLINRVGSGNNLIIKARESVTLVCTATGVLEIV